MPYSGDPSTGPVDEIRFWLQDTGNPPLLSDAEINYLITTTADDANGNAILIASHACRVICAKYAGEVSINGDGITYSGDSLQAKYTQLANDLRAEYNRLVSSNALPTFGRSCVVSAPIFGIGMDDNPEAGPQTFFPSENNDGELGYLDPANYQTP